MSNLWSEKLMATNGLSTQHMRKVVREEWMDIIHIRFNGYDAMMPVPIG